MLRLQIEDLDDSPRTWESAGSQVVLGRSSDCELPFPKPHHQSVSWRHAQITVLDGRALLTDLGSSNGTYLNGQRLAQPAPLEAGNVFSLGLSGPRLTVLAIGDEAATQRAERTLVLASPASTTSAAVAALVAEGPSAAQPQHAGGTTRMLVAQLQRSHRLLGSGLAVLALLLIAGIGYGLWWGTHREPDVDTGPPLPAVQSTDPNDEGTSKRLDPQEIYRQVLLATVSIVNHEVGCTGSGAVIDLEQRLVLTNEHVVGNAEEVDVYFPDFVDGQAVPNRKHYWSDRLRPREVEPVSGRVLLTDPRVDLAIVQLDKLPESARAIALSEQSVAPGDTIHSVGNPGASDALWVYHSGTVRQVYRKRLSMDTGIIVEAMIVETQAPLNGGDSGGPVVDDFGMLVAVNQSSLSGPEVQLMNNCIDVSEVRLLLDELAAEENDSAAPDEEADEEMQPDEEESSPDAEDGPPNRSPGRDGPRRPRSRDQ